MDGQLSFATLEYAGKKKRTKRDAKGRMDATDAMVALLREQLADMSMTRARLRSVILLPALHRRATGLQCDQIIANGGDLLDQVLAGRIVPAVNGVRMVGHTGHAARLDHQQGRVLYSPRMPVLRFIEPCLPSSADCLLSGAGCTKSSTTATG
jgi:hypothetical protein